MDRLLSRGSWGSSGEAPLGASVDIVGLGRVLSFLLHEESSESRYPQDSVRSQDFRSIYSPSDENTRADPGNSWRSSAPCVAKRCNMIQRIGTRAYPSVPEFAAALSSSLTGPTSDIPAVLSEGAAVEPGSDGTAEQAKLTSLNLLLQLPKQSQ